jgi:hypothetical protein
MTITEKLLAEINRLNNLKYPEVGYVYFANVRGFSSKASPRFVYEIINEQGGVRYCNELNNSSNKIRCDKLRGKIQELLQKQRTINIIA